MVNVDILHESLPKPSHLKRRRSKEPIDSERVESEVEIAMLMLKTRRLQRGRDQTERLGNAITSLMTLRWKGGHRIFLGLYARDMLL